MSQFKYLHYTLRLHSSVIVSTLSGSSHLIQTQGFIPGGALRGSVAARLIAQGSNGESEEFRALILSGHIRYLHAYPVVAGMRALPAPASWRRSKENEREGKDLASFSGLVSDEMDAEGFQGCWPEEASVALSYSFASVGSSGPSGNLGRSLIDARLHQQQDREKGKPWKDDKETPHGALFAYEYLQAEQGFHGVIQVQEEAFSRCARIQELLTADKLLLGRSRRAGYGGEASICFFSEQPQEWSSVSKAHEHGVSAGQVFRLMLTSSYIGRHPQTGQIDPIALEYELCERLSGDVRIERKRWAFENVGGFNQKWRLELPQARAVVAGSILVLKSSQGIAPEALRKIEHEGLGERRIEGFGRMLFLKHEEKTKSLSFLVEPYKPNRVEDMGASTYSAKHNEQIEIVERRILLTATRSELDRIALLDIARNAEHIPTGSLLARLRTIFRGVLDEESARKVLADLRVWCSGEGPNSLKPIALEKLKRCELSGSKLPDNLHLWLGLFTKAHDESDMWKMLLHASGNPDTLLSIPHRFCLTSEDAARSILRAHGAELSVYLIDAVLAALAKRARKARNETHA